MTLFERDGEDGIAGVRVGVVTDNEDPEGLARVKLRFPWRDADDESAWARIATPMAGNGYGSYFLPEVDDEVLVAFAGGDIHRPFVVGSLYNGVQTPPETNEGTNDVRSVHSRSGHRLAFDDAEDGRLTIETAGGHRLVLDDTDGSERVTVADDSGDNAVTLDGAEGTVSVQADSELRLSAPTVTIDADEVSVSGRQGLSLRSKSRIDIASKGQLRVTSSGVMGIDASGPLSLSGTLITLN